MLAKHLNQVIMSISSDKLSHGPDEQFSQQQDYSVFNFDREESLRDYSLRSVSNEPHVHFFDQEPQEQEHKIHESPIFCANQNTMPKQTPVPFDSLHQQRQSFKNLMEQYNIMKEMIVVTSKAEIFAYGIGFESVSASEQEQAKIQDEGRKRSREEQLALRKCIIGMQPSSYRKQLQIIQRDKMSKALFTKPALKKSLANSKMQNPFVEYQKKKQQQQKKNTVLVDFCQQAFQQPERVAQQVNLIKSCYNQTGNQAQKRRLLNISDKLRLLEKMINEHMEEKRGQAYICGICKKKFKTGRKLGGHLSRKHHNMNKKIKKVKDTQWQRKRYFKEYMDDSDQKRDRRRNKKRNRDSDSSGSDQSSF